MSERLFTKRRLKTAVALCFFLLLSAWLSPFWSSSSLITITSKVSPASSAASSPSKSSVPAIESNSASQTPKTSSESKQTISASPSPSISSASSSPSKSSATSTSSNLALSAASSPSPSPSATSTLDLKTKSSDVCMGYAKDLDIVIVVKTGATEASRRLPHQLVSFLSCAKDDVLVFSDMEQWIGDLHLHDSLEDVAAEAKVNNTDFNLYFDQKQHILEGQDIGQLSNRAGESWALDKYKNIHTAQKAWKLKPNRSWYFFIDVDTYVVWSSLFAYLKQFDPSKKHYLGAAVPGEFGQFAHGGSGYALSRTTMESLTGEDAKAIALDFDVGARNNCCGDIQMSKPLYERQSNLTDAHPMINGDAPNNYRLGPRLWCKPLITMHHIGAEQMNVIWQYERSRESPAKPLLFSELWTSYLEPKLPSRREDWDTLSEDVKRVTIPAEREDWDNFSEDVTYLPPKPDASKWEAFLHWFSPPEPVPDAYESIEKCVKACKEMPECYQYKYTDQVCQLQKSFRFGQKKGPDGQKRWTSGWDLDKIKKFKEENSPCKEVDFTAYHQ